MKKSSGIDLSLDYFVMKDIRRMRADGSVKI